MCAWDILNTIATASAILFPINLRMKKGYWVLPIIAFFLAVFSPVFFDLANGSSYYVNGSYAPNWSAASIFGSLFVFGPTAVLALLPFSLVGMAMAHYMLEDKKATGLFRAFFLSLSPCFVFTFWVACFNRTKKISVCFHFHDCHDDWS